MATKKTAKKVATPKTKRVPVNALVLTDSIIWAVVKRGFLTSKVVTAYTAQADAEAWASYMDGRSPLSFNQYVVQRVVLLHDAA